jgi:signal transduction histidine kinase/CheY-like chemotaxis protein
VFLEIWVDGQSGLRVLGNLEDSAQFKVPATPIGDLYHTPSGTQVRVRGTVEGVRAGSALTVRDATGQVEVRSIQGRRVAVGTEVEAVGRVGISGSRWVLDAALYRQLPAPAVADAAEHPAATGVLKTVAQVRALGAQEAARGLPVDIRGTVTWSLPDSDFFYLEDLTGGIRVQYNRSKTGTFPFVKYIEVRGVTRAGQVSTAVELRDFSDLGSMDYPPAKPITLDEAMTGAYDGEWVEMRGFVSSIISEGDWRWIFVTTPSGDFAGHLQNPVNFVANLGSRIRMHGVCEAQAGPNGRVSGITLRVPFLHDITIEEDAPADSYDLPLRRVADLEQISASQDMLRVRVTGTVQYAVPGQRVFLEEANKGLMLLSREALPLMPGDRIEAVGILGREGARTILREAVYRRTGTGPAPQPVALSDIRLLVPAADYRLVRLRAKLIDMFSSSGHTRLALQQGGTYFDASLDQPGDAPGLDLPVGAGLEMTGIYQLVFDDFRQARGFQLRLRTPEDVRVYLQPRFWTARRSLAVTAVLGGCVLLGLAWIGALRRRVLKQTAQIRSQMEEQSRLQAEVHRAARLESLGRLAGGIAHDYNNLLTVIMGNLYLIKLNPAVMGAEAEQLAEIEKGAMRARDLTRKLLTFSEGGEPLRATVDLSGIVRQAAEEATAGTNVRCACEIAPDLRAARADPEQISQAVHILVKNAVRAAPGGTVRITLANAQVRNGTHALAAGDYLKMTVLDTGQVIPAEELPKIFDPFFGTKRAGEGLDLATAHSIARKHLGHIEVQSSAGQGTAFTLWLPAAASEAKAAPQAPARPAAAATNSPARVLLMDDEESIRRIASTVLRRMGLDPTAAPDGESALREFEAAEKAGRPFALVILDLTIPDGIGGQATIEAIRKTGSKVPAIVCSGYSSDPVMANFRDYGFDAVVPKPYDLSLLEETVRSLLPADARD